MAGEVTRRQQKLIVPEPPPIFLGSGSHGLGQAKAEVESDISKYCSNSTTEQTMGLPPKEPCFWTKARRKREWPERCASDDELEGMSFVPTILISAVL